MAQRCPCVIHCDGCLHPVCPAGVYCLTHHPTGDHICLHIIHVLSLVSSGITALSCSLHHIVTYHQQCCFTKQHCPAWRSRASRLPSGPTLQCGRRSFPGSLWTISCSEYYSRWISMLLCQTSPYTMSRSSQGSQSTLALSDGTSHPVLWSPAEQPPACSSARVSPGSVLPAFEGDNPCGQALQCPHRKQAKHHYLGWPLAPP